MSPIRSVSVLILALAPVPAAAANCQVTPFTLNFGIDGDTRMVVRSGAPCGLSFVQGGPGRTVSAGGINHLGISEPPSHGRATTSGFNAWGYQSQKGYVGKDRFVLDVGGEIMYRRIIAGTSHIAVDVDVVP